MSHTKVALVTGASAGIGKACALALIKAGFAVVLTARRKDKLDEAAAEGMRLGTCLAVPSDMTDPASIAALFATVTEKFGRLDLLFNNAGVGAPAVPLEDLPFEKWQAAVATILESALSMHWYNASVIPAGACCRIIWLVLSSARAPVA